MKIITIGGATTDIFLTTEPFRLTYTLACEERSFLLFEEGHKITVDELHFHTGGGATNTAVSFKRLGLDVATFIKTGNDKPAEFIKQRLIDTGIDTAYTQTTSAYTSGHSFIFPCKNGDRTVLSYRGANEHLIQAEIPHTLGAYDAYITSLSGASAQLLMPITDILKQHKRLIAVNPGSHQLTAQEHNVYDALANIDIFIVNTDEAYCFMRTLAERNAAVCPTFDLHLFCKEILTRGPRIVVVTDGAKGVYVATHEETLFHPSIPTQVVNTLGAGDAFGSTFVAYLLKGKTIKEAMLYGIINAASVLTYLDAKSGLLSAEELERRYVAMPKSGYRISKTN